MHPLNVLFCLLLMTGCWAGDADWRDGGVPDGGSSQPAHDGGDALGDALRRRQEADARYERSERSRTLVSLIVFVAIAAIPVFVAWMRAAPQFAAILFLAIWTILGLAALRFMPSFNVPMGPHISYMAAWILALWRTGRPA